MAVMLSQDERDEAVAALKLAEEILDASGAEVTHADAIKYELRTVLQLLGE